MPITHENAGARPCVARDAVVVGDRSHMLAGAVVTDRARAPGASYRGRGARNGWTRLVDR
jgi:hypothetical protein